MLTEYIIINMYKALACVATTVMSQQDYDPMNEEIIDMNEVEVDMNDKYSYKQIRRKPSNVVVENPDAPVILNLKDGSRYSGEMKDGKPHGKGMQVWNSRKKYVGDFVDGKRQG